MSKIAWDVAGERFFETGVKNGVLYPRNISGLYPLGVAWNGLTAVTESPSGAEATPIYADDTKYLNLISTEEFGATIEAYTYPDEFAICDGSEMLIPGMAIGQQKRTSFGLSYRTTIGNDIDSEIGYKLHLIYGAIAAPSEKAYGTINDSPEAITFSWEVSTTPVEVTGFKPTSSVVIDSTQFTTEQMTALETILYGAVGVDARLPLPDEVYSLLGGALPSAVALSTIVPADAATGVATNAAIVITFNNKILEEAISVMTAAGALVAITKSWDATGKILTIAHASAFAGTTLHLVTVAGVIDIYNQALATTVKKFTTV